MALYNLEVAGNVMRFQPNLSYLTKIKIFLVLAIICFAAGAFLPDNDVKYFLIMIGVILAGYIIYEFLFVARVTMIFDRNTRKVYKKLPGIYTKTLMDFDDLRFVNNTSYGDLIYTIGAKKSRFVKNYPITDSFSDSKNGIKRQKQFETIILKPLLEFIQ